MFYFQLVTRVHGELDRAAAKPYEQAYEQSESMFDRLLKEIRILEGELRQSKMKAQARQMRDLVELGRSNAKMIRTNLASKNRALVSGDALAIVSEQVCNVAKELLPNAQVTLSAAATDALRRILCIINERQARRETERLSKSGLTNDLNRIQREILAVGDSLFAGAEAAAKSDFGGRDAAALRIKAQGQVGKAISILQGLKAEYDGQ